MRFLQKLFFAALLLSMAGPHAVAQCGFNISLTSSAQTAPVFTPVIFTASVVTSGSSPQAAAGASVTFLDGSTVIGGGSTDQSGTVSISVLLDVGAHSVTATTCGGLAASGAVTVLVVPLPASSVVITSVPAAPTVGQPVTLIATIVTANGNIAPTGTVQFLNGSTALGTATVGNNNQASISVTLPPGSHAITANYSGDSAYPPASATTAVSVRLLPTSLSVAASAASTAIGQPVTLTATLAATPPAGIAAPTGQVQFFSANVSGPFNILLNKTLIGMANLASGTATVTVNALPTGSIQVLASYSGDANWAASTSNLLTETVAQGQPTVTWTSSLLDSAGLHLAAQITVPSGAPTPTGTVQILDTTNSSVLSTVAVANSAVTALLPAKPDLTGHALTISYSGDSNYAAAASGPLTPIAITDVTAEIPAAVAPDEIVTIFGGQLANATITSSTPQSPGAALGGASVQITDSSRASYPIPILFASPGQLNLVLPSQIAPGTAIIAVTSPAGVTFSRTVSVAATAPALFTTTNQPGGPAVAEAIRVNADESQTVLNASSIDVSSGSVYLVLYGTGIRHRTSLTSVTLTIGTQTVAAAYAGPQAQVAGLDQINALLPVTLKGAGQVNVHLTADGANSNTVTLTFQ